MIEGVMAMIVCLQTLLARFTSRLRLSCLMFVLH